MCLWLLMEIILVENCKFGLDLLEGALKSYVVLLFVFVDFVGPF